jgi:hypothetical protein
LFTFSASQVLRFAAATAAVVAAAAADKLTTSVQVVKEHKKVNVDNVTS